MPGPCIDGPGNNGAGGGGGGGGYQASAPFSLIIVNVYLSLRAHDLNSGCTHFLLLHKFKP